MANTVPLTPDQQAAVRAFMAKYPTFDITSFGGAASYTPDYHGPAPRLRIVPCLRFTA